MNTYRKIPARAYLAVTLAPTLTLILVAGAVAQTKPTAPASPPAASATPAATDNDPALAPTAPTNDAAPDGSVGGVGDINLFPKRVVIDSHNRIASVGLFNHTVNAGGYEITITDMMMTETGQLVDLDSVKDPAARARVKAASSILHFSPHRVTLGANQAQTVRIMAHVPPDLPDGEYRAHFSAIALPPDDGGLSIQQATGHPTQNKGIAVHITPRFGIAIPVIVRVGATTLSVGLADIALKTAPNGDHTIGFVITRQGTRSAYGTITVTRAGDKTPLALAKGLGVYPELAQRRVTLTIDPKADPKAYARGAHLTVTYTDDDMNPGAVLARQDVIVP